jgi:hypothetical protein
LVVACLGVAAVAVIVGVTLRQGVERGSIPASPVASSPPAEAWLALAEATYEGGLEPLLQAAADEAAALAALGERRERNLLTIRAAHGRMEERLAAVDEFAATQPTPDRLAAALMTYREGAVAVRRAMAEAQAGFVRLDWDRVARATVLMGQGAAALRRAERLLDEAAGVATAGTPAR